MIFVFFKKNSFRLRNLKQCFFSSFYFVLSFFLWNISTEASVASMEGNLALDKTLKTQACSYQQVYPKCHLLYSSQKSSPPQPLCDTPLSFTKDLTPTFQIIAPGVGPVDFNRIYRFIRYINTSLNSLEIQKNLIQNSGLDSQNRFNKEISILVKKRGFQYQELAEFIAMAKGYQETFSWYQKAAQDMVTALNLGIELSLAERIQVLKILRLSGQREDLPLYQSTLHQVVQDPFFKEFTLDSSLTGLTVELLKSSHNKSVLKQQELESPLWIQLHRYHNQSILIDFLKVQKDLLSQNKSEKQLEKSPFVRARDLTETISVLESQRSEWRSKLPQLLQPSLDNFLLKE
jgi:hypothetical protein